MRLGVVENAIAMFAVSGVVLGAAMSRSGAFAGLSASDAALSMQLLLLMMALPLMFLAAMVDERRQGEARFTMVFRATPDAITISSLRDGRFIEVNESFERATGFSRGHALGRTALELGLWKSPDERRGFLARLLADGRVRDFPRSTTDPDGTRRHGMLSAERIELDGEDAVITVQRDVTNQVLAEEEKARIEAQLQQGRKMEAIGQLAGGIAHDFNNLLQAIRGYTEVATSRLPHNHPAQMALQQVTRASDQAATLTSQLLTFSRREALKPQPIDLNALVGDLAGILRRLIGEHIELRVEEGAALPPMLADPEPGGAGRHEPVPQRARRDAVGRTDHDPHRRRRLHRRGLPRAPMGARRRLGVAVRRRRRQRDPGRRAAAHLRTVLHDQERRPRHRPRPRHRRTRSSSATAACCRSTRAPGAGTTFTIYVPVAEAPAVAAGPVSHDPPPARARRRLRRNDPARRRRTVRARARGGVPRERRLPGARRVRRRRSRSDRARRSSPFDLALLDVAMPFRTGRQVFDTIREVRPSLPVVFTSGYSFGELTEINADRRVHSAQAVHARAAARDDSRRARGTPNPDMIGRVLTIGARSCPFRPDRARSLKM